MKKFVKNNLKVFISVVITAIICTSGTVYAVSQYYAENISFTPSKENQEKGFTATNVEEALNNLYDNSYDFKNTTKQFNISNGTNIKRSVSLEVDAGTYLILANIEQSGSSSSVQKSFNKDYEIDLIYNNGKCESLTGKYIKSAASSAFISQYLWSSTWHSLFICNFDKTTEISVSNFQSGTYYETISSVYLESVKIR